MVSYKLEYLQKTKQKLAKLPRFKFRCYVCHRNFGKGFTFHHLWYVSGEPTYRDFKSSVDYQLAVLPYVERNPKQFLLLCHKHHHALENLKRFGRATRKRLLRAVSMSE